MEPFPYKHQPFKHQREEFERTRDLESWAFFMEMGTGKSKLIIDTIAWNWMNKRINGVLIVAKKGEYRNWPLYELIAHMPDCVDYDVHVFDAGTYGRKKKDNENWWNFQKFNEKLKIFVVNIESIASPKCEGALKWFYKHIGNIFLVIDEATCVKNYASKRSVAAQDWAKQSKMKRILTGTPEPNSPMDLWGEALILGNIRERLGHANFYGFKNYHTVFEPAYYGDRVYNKVVGYRHVDELQARVKKWATIMTKEQCLDLPPKIYVKKAVELTREQNRLYEEMRDKAMLEIQGHELEVVNVLSQITKLHQIICGQIKIDDDTYVSVENNRIATLVEILEDYTGKAIIWATYRQTLEDVVKKLKEEFGEESTVHYYGGTSTADRAKAIELFQDRGSPVRFFVAHPQAAGYGITLTAANLVVYYSNGYNLEHRLQSEDRCHRIGQTGSVTIVDLVTPDSVDERIIDILRAKKNLAHEVLGTRMTEWI